jgi:glycosyltransferase involved in cell wall biosynthesis
MAKLCADRLVYVSESHRNLLEIDRARSVVIHNSIDKRIEDAGRRHEYTHRTDGTFNVLMPSSLRHYKGVDVFVQLAESIRDEHIKFHLVLNDEPGRIDEFSKRFVALENLEVHQTTDAIEKHYECASLLLNLSFPDEWIETFGLTLVEAFAFGIPVIAPPVGGPTEIISDGEDGYLISSRDFTRLKDMILELSVDEQRCLNLSAKARIKSGTFGFEANRRKVLDLLADQLHE